MIRLDKATFFFIVLLVHGCQSPDVEQTASSPNVLLIMVDDMGYGDLSTHGNPYIHTPHLDQLARESVEYKYFYVSPVCAPTRASLLTGMYHQRVGVHSVTNGFETMDPDATTLAEILKTVGYRTSIYGKWHLGEYYPSIPQAQGFDDFVGFRTGHTNQYFDPVLEHNGKNEQQEGFITDILTDRALDFMQSGDDPFFCYLAYNAPHTPLQIDSSYFSKFLEEGLDDRTARVYGLVENIDENIGRVMTNLSESNLLENTIIIFLSDNGPISGWQVPQEKMRYNAGLRNQKFTIFEGGIRTAAFWKWENTWTPRLDSLTVAAHIDVVPTLINTLGINTQLEFDGLDLTPSLLGGKSIERVYFEKYDLQTLQNPSPVAGGIAISFPYKIVSDTALYHITNDVSEKQNIKESNAQKQTELLSAFKNFEKDSYAQWGYFPRPIAVGFNEENPVGIKAHHGKANGNVQFVGYRGTENKRLGVHPRGVDGDWTKNWIEPGDAMSYQIDFTEDAIYELGVNLNGKITSSQSTFTLEVGDTSLTQNLQPLNTDHWEYFPFGKLPLHGTKELKLALKSLHRGDSVSINELIILKNP